MHIQIFIYIAISANVLILKLINYNYIKNYFIINNLSFFFIKDNSIQFFKYISNFFINKILQNINLVFINQYFYNIIILIQIFIKILFNKLSTIFNICKIK